MNWTLVSIVIIAAVIALFALGKRIKRAWRSERAFARRREIDRKSKEADFPD